MSGPEFDYPQDWIRGQLLNVRNTGSSYAVTLLGEEYDYRNPNGLQFADARDTQAFVSWWYDRQHADPRAA